MLPLTVMPRPAAIRWYLQNQRARLDSLHLSRQQDYRITLERYASAFVDQVDISVEGVDEPSNPLKARAVTRVRPVWNDFARRTIADLTAEGLWQSKYLRGGGAYPSNVQAKRLDKWFSQERTLINDVPSLWLSPEYQAIRPSVAAFFQSTRDRLVRNIEVARTHPELLLGNKPPSTGTGLKDERLSTREEAAKNFPLYADRYQEQMLQYWDALIEAISLWPETGSIIDTGPMFKGANGSRSDCDYELQPDGSILCYAKSRSVGPGFESLLSNNLLSPKTYRRQVIDQVSSEYAIRPWDARGIAEIVLLPSATLPGKPDDMVCVSADLGFCQSTRSISRDGALQLGTETESFGADGVLGSGIYFRTRYGPVYAFLLSGMVITQDIYIVMMANIIAEWARKRGLTRSDIRWTEIGDDIHFAIRRDLLPELFAKFGNYLKLKGMFVEGKWHGRFYLGQYIWTNSETGEVLMYISPRAVKSETSAKANQSTPLPEGVIGQTIRLKVPTEAKSAASETIARYPELFFYRGSRAEATTIITRDIVRARLELARVGIADWAGEDAAFIPDEVEVATAVEPISPPEVIKQEGDVMVINGTTDGAGATPDPASALPKHEEVSPELPSEVYDEAGFQKYVETELQALLKPEDYQRFTAAWRAHEEWHTKACAVSAPAAVEETAEQSPSEVKNELPIPIKAV